MFPKLTPVTLSDNAVLFEIYVSARAEELKFVPWTGEAKGAFLESQFQAQNRHYISKYPDASFDLVKIGDQTAGRLYSAELADEIRIIDITILPQFRNRDIGTSLLSNISNNGSDKQKSVRIYLETYSPAQTLFSRLGFQPVFEDRVYCLWEKTPEEQNQAIKGLAISAAEKQI